MKKIVTMFMILASLWGSVCYAMTDDAGVLGGLEKNDNLYNYLNMYHYRLWKADHRFSQHDMYISQDDAVIVSIFDDKLNAIFILKSGYQTNKGIEVGMTANDMIRGYVPVYEDSDYTFDAWHSQGGQVVGNYDSNYAKYFSVEYISKENEGLDFIFDKYTGKIVLIRYQRNRHGNTRALDDVKSYILLPRGR